MCSMLDINNPCPAGPLPITYLVGYTSAPILIIPELAFNHDLQK